MDMQRIFEDEGHRLAPIALKPDPQHNCKQTLAT
jgi:hypothetical protein